MKSIITTFFLLVAGNFLFAQCPISAPSSHAVNQTRTYSLPSGSGQCSNCYDWDVVGAAQVIGSDMGNSVQIRRNSNGSFTVSVRYINEAGCQSCSVFVPSIVTGCNFTVAINNQYFLGLGNVGISANTIPQVGMGATYNWTVTYQNNTTNSATTNVANVFFPATTANKIVSASVTVDFNGCSAADNIFFFPPIPEVNGGFGKLAGGNGSGEADAPERKFELYPNPVNNSVIVKGANRNGYTISVLDLQGKYLIKDQPLSPSHNLDAVAPGVYLYVITSQNGFRQEGKIVKQ
ncbi:MAG: T9SS type A sorting domain-containing protein [Bacteroidota bacterium]